MFEAGVYMWATDLAPMRTFGVVWLLVAVLFAVSLRRHAPAAAAVALCGYSGLQAVFVYSHIDRAVAAEQAAQLPPAFMWAGPARWGWWALISNDRGL